MEVNNLKGEENSWNGIRLLTAQAAERMLAGCSDGSTKQTRLVQVAGTAIGWAGAVLDAHQVGGGGDVVLRKVARRMRE